MPTDRKFRYRVIAVHVFSSEDDDDVNSLEVLSKLSAVGGDRSLLADENGLLIARVDVLSDDVIDVRMLTHEMRAHRLDTEYLQIDDTGEEMDG